MKENRQARNRAVLTADAACEIFLMKSSASHVDDFQSVSSLLMARKYGVSPKTIRDIWNRSAPSYLNWLCYRAFFSISSVANRVLFCLQSTGAHGSRQLAGSGIVLLRRHLILCFLKVFSNTGRASTQIKMRLQEAWLLPCRLSRTAPQLLTHPSQLALFQPTLNICNSQWTRASTHPAVQHSATQRTAAGPPCGRRRKASSIRAE